MTAKPVHLFTFLWLTFTAIMAAGGYVGLINALVRGHGAAGYLPLSSSPLQCASSVSP